MKKIFKKAMTVLGSAALIGMTVGGAFAASYPSPFTSNTAIVVGSNADALDGIGASLIKDNLNVNAVTTSVVGATITGESAGLADGSDLLYLNDEFNEEVGTLTKEELPSILADGTFTDNDGTDYDFEQTLVVGSGSSIVFSDSDNDLDDPALIADLSTTATATAGIYDLAIDFTTAVAFNATDSEGEEITLFGKTYTVGTATDANTLVLLGGADGAIINAGESTTMVVDGISYDVSLTGLSTATDTQASVTVDGDTKTFTEGQTKTMGGVDVYVKTVFREGDGLGYVEVQLGSDKLTFETGSAVMTGSDNDDIDGTLVTLTPDTATGVSALTGITITVAAEDSDANHLLPGEAFVDSVFGTIIVNFNSIEGGPEFSGEKDTGRTTLEIQKENSRELQLELTDNAGYTNTVPFTFEGALSDEDGNTISIVEGASIEDEGYFILNSGSDYHLMQIKDLDLDEGALSDVKFENVITGEAAVTAENKDFTSGATWNYKGETYTITNDTATSVTVVSSDYGTGIANGNLVDVFPVIELVSGQDTRFAFTDDVQAMTDFITNVSTTVTLTLPSGTVDVAGIVATADSVTVGSTTIAVDNNASVAVGDVYYDFAVTEGASTNGVNVTIGVANDPDAAATGAVTTPGILFVEDEDKSETTTTTKPAIHIVTTDDGSYSTVSSPEFTGTMDTDTWDDTDWTGWLTNYGTYVWKDTSDTNQDFVGLSYGDGIMYADVSIAEGESDSALTTTSSAGVLTVMDDAVSSVDGMNLVVVGGSAINSVAAELLGAAYAEASFTAATDIAAGEFLIQSFARSGKTALLVAGYNAADTEKAITYLLNADNAVVTTTGTKYKGTSSTSADIVIS